MTPDLAVAAAAGTLRNRLREDARFPHPWTSEGVVVEVRFTGAHLLHLAAAACVLNDLYREAEAVGVVLQGVLVRARGDFDRGTWRSTGIEYDVELDSDAAPARLDALLAHVDAVAEVPRALRHATSVRRVPPERSG